LGVEGVGCGGVDSLVIEPRPESGLDCLICAIFAVDDCLICAISARELGYTEVRRSAPGRRPGDARPDDTHLIIK